MCNGVFQINHKDFARLQKTPYYWSNMLDLSCNLELNVVVFHIQPMKLTDCFDIIGRNMEDRAGAR